MLCLSGSRIMILYRSLLTRREHTLGLPLSLCAVFAVSLCLVQHSCEHPILYLFMMCTCLINTRSLPSFIPRGINVTTCTTQILLVIYMSTVFSVYSNRHVVLKDCVDSLGTRPFVFSLVFIDKYVG